MNSIIPYNSPLTRGESRLELTERRERGHLTLRKRALLLITGFLIFFALAPVIVLTAQGYRFDLKTRRLTGSGTLVVKTEPRGADLWLDGQKLDHTPLVKRFLAPGEYQARVSKDKYRPWQKRVGIFEGQVSFLPDQNTRINLLLEQSENIKTADGIADSFAYEDLLFLIDNSGRKISASYFNSSLPAMSASTTRALTNPRFADARLAGASAEFIIAADEGLFHISGEHARALPKLTSAKFGETEGTILGLNEKNELVEIAAGSSRILQNRVLAFARSGPQIYILARDTGNQYLLQRLQDSRVETVIETPPFSSADIIASPNNQIFLRGASDIYSVGEKLEKINSNVEFAYWDSHGNFLLYGNRHEAWAYEPLGPAANTLLLRSSAPTSIPQFHKAAGYTFVISGTEVRAIEADKSGQPNVYSLLQAANLKKISLNDEGNIMAVLDGESLRFLKIR